MEIRQRIFGFLRAEPEDIAGESYGSMVERQDAERLAFQKNCRHKKVSFRFSPLATCSNCQKALRYITDDERKKLLKDNPYLTAIKEAKKLEKQRV